MSITRSMSPEAIAGTPRPSAAPADEATAVLAKTDAAQTRPQVRAGHEPSGGRVASEPGGAATVQRFVDRLRDRLIALEGRLRAAKADVDAWCEQVAEGLMFSFDEDGTWPRSQKANIEEVSTNLNTRAERRMARAESPIHEKRAKGETQKLNARADRAEAHAAGAIDHAAASIDDVRDAMLYAAAARFDALAAHKRTHSTR